MQLELRKVLKIVLLCIAAMAIAGTVAVGIIIATAPPLEISDASPDGYRTTVYDMNGEEILTLAGEESNRIYVNIGDLPDYLGKAFVAVEDERFFDHKGIDLKGIARALWKDISSGSMAEGASTITQQLVKNNIFSDWTQEKGAGEKIVRKIREQYLALRLEKKTSKDWILENYMNTIYLGDGTWGVETAAQHYFGKPASELTVSEAAVLAGITQSPSGYNPIKNPEASRKRQLTVLSKLHEQGYVSDNQYEEAVSDNVYERVGQNSIDVHLETLSFFEDAMVYEVIHDLTGKLGYSEADAWNALYRGGLRIYTTQDTSLQEICEDTVNGYAGYKNNEQISVVMMDQATGAVRAIVGGRGEKKASLTLNRATSSVRQPGSTIKIVGEYATLFEKGEITLGSVYDDCAYSYTDGTPIYNSSGTYSGKTTIRKAITNSTNVVAVKCFKQAGLDSVWAQLQKFGFTHLKDGDRVEALSLGGTANGVTNLEMTAAYAAIANMGIYTRPHYYTSVCDRQGKIMLQNDILSDEVIKGTTAALLTLGMKDVLTEGTGVKAWFPGMSLAGKSGTTSNLKDAWFVGFTPYYTCGVWGGYDDNSSLSSTTFVKEIWGKIMKQAHAGLKNVNFDYDAELKTAEICTKCGKLAVRNLCSDTLQGDMTKTEYYLAGTEPKESCDCHVKVKLCSTSEMPAGTYCYSKTEKVFLKSGTAGTKDAEYVIPKNFENGETCSIHTSWWDYFTERDEPENSDSPSGGQNSWQNQDSGNGSYNQNENNSGNNQDNGHNNSGSHENGGNSGNNPNGNTGWGWNDFSDWIGGWW